ncbi:glucose-6-phosphate translocase-like protein [Dinothrombium tinctorium]|uniref:Glucose-6-phosphate translocase-like protein n=1 Tax=Dinothrombium tinctorium TaxID=1965070 RepID=A0A3S4QFT7_9ACAR|nr:glucose-6-phosphate translocase-like protein [Dinothrombium tinctorium]RWS05148.1 glucose-6-phosphate translocase-like protein [Dinothrombium tinctorium]RWS05554.1 glucose-6-phosphate translocase-like protein [Dinothrombium tinctorium]
MLRENRDRLFQYYQASIFTSLFIGYACYAYNRKSVSFAMPKLMEEGLSKSEAGLIASSQNLAYAISKFLGGILSDRISSKSLFSSGLFMSGVVTILFASSNSIPLLTALWFLNGFAQGAGWPACAKLLRKWYSPSQFGTWWSVLSASANISGGVSPFVASYIILNYGWRVSLAVAGIVSLILSAVTVLTVINSPTELGFESFTKDEESKTDKKESKFTSKDILKNPFLWLVSFAYLSVFCSKTSAVDWGQLYLIEDRHRNQYIGSAFTSSVETGGFIGGILAGWLTDYAMKMKQKSKGNPRMPVAILFMIGVTLCFHLFYFNVNQHSSQLFISSVGFLLGACLYGPIAIFGVVASESVPINLSGTAHAMVALAANIGAIISGLPFSFIAKYYSWGGVFLLLEILSGLTAFVMLCLKNLDSNMIDKEKRS